MQAYLSKVRKVFTVTEKYCSIKIVTPLGLFSLAALGIAPAQAANSSIEQVTIYQGLASVTRALPINGSGEQTLIFSCLSPYLDKDSLSVQAGSGVNVGEVSIETLSGEQAAQCQYQGDTEVQAQQDTLADITAELEAANLAKSYMQNLTKVTQTQYRWYISQQRAGSRDTSGCYQQTNLRYSTAPSTSARRP